MGGVTKAMAEEMTKPRCRGCRRILVEGQDLFQWFGPPTQTPEDDEGWWHLRCHQDRHSESAGERNKRGLWKAQDET